VTRKAEEGRFYVHQHASDEGFKDTHTNLIRTERMRTLRTGDTVVLVAKLGVFLIVQSAVFSLFRMDVSGGAQGAALN
jgi:hypothetical protein